MHGGVDACERLYALYVQTRARVWGPVGLS